MNHVMVLVQGTSRTVHVVLRGSSRQMNSKGVKCVLSRDATGDKDSEKSTADVTAYCTEEEVSAARSRAFHVIEMRGGTFPTAPSLGGEDSSWSYSDTAFQSFSEEMPSTLISDPERFVVRGSVSLVCGLSRRRGVDDSRTGSEQGCLSLAQRKASGGGA